jgi:hypothetical protein
VLLRDVVARRTGEHCPCWDIAAEIAGGFDQ